MKKQIEYKNIGKLIEKYQDCQQLIDGILGYGTIAIWTGKLFIIISEVYANPNKSLHTISYRKNIPVHILINEL